MRVLLIIMRTLRSGYMLKSDSE